MINSDLLDVRNDLKNWIDYLKSDDHAIDKPQDIWLSVNEVTELIGCSQPTVYRKFNNGEIKYSKPAGIMVWISDIALYVIERES